MKSYDLEIRAARSRLDEIQSDLSEEIGRIQAETSDRIVRATMAAAAEMMPLRIFLQSLGAGDVAAAAEADAPSGLSSRTPDSPPVGRKSPRTSRPAKERKAKPPGVTGQVALLTILNGATEPMDAKAVDDAMLAEGRSQATTRKERYKQFTAGNVTRDAQDRISITEQGRALLESLKSA